MVSKEDTREDTEKEECEGYIHKLHVNYARVNVNVVDKHIRQYRHYHCLLHMSFLYTSYIYISFLKIFSVIYRGVRYDI